MDCVILPMLQQVIILLIFFAAVLYIARLIYRSFQAKSSCTTGCGKCNAVDFNKIEEQIKSKGQLGKN
jgi:hypothetical protein